MGKGGKYMAPRKKSSHRPFVFLAVILILILIGTFFFLRKDNQEKPVPIVQKNTPYNITSTLSADDVQWAQATLWKETGVHIHLTQQQISDIVSALNRLEKSSFEQIHVDDSLSVMLNFSDKEILLHYDGERVGFVFDSATAENFDPGSWSVSDPILKDILDPIADLDNTKQWISYMTANDLKNLCLNINTLTWDFFEDFGYWTISADEIKIPIEESYYILVGGNREGRPESLYLIENENPQNKMDIRSSDVNTLLSVFQKPEENETSSTTSFFSQEQAKQHGYVVMQDGDVRHNQISWQSFIELTEAGEPAAVTVMHYTREESNTTYIRYGVIFDGSIYTLKIETEEQQLSCSFTGLEMTSGTFNLQQEPYDCYIRYTLTGGTDTDDVVIYEDRIATPDLAQVNTIALHLKEAEPPLAVYEKPSEVEDIISLLNRAEYMMVPPDDYILGVKLMLHTQNEQEVMLEIDILQGVYRYGNSYYCYGELSDLFRVLGISQWPEEVQQEYYGYLYYS